MTTIFFIFIFIILTWCINKKIKNDKEFFFNFVFKKYKMGHNNLQFFRIKSRKKKQLIFTFFFCVWEVLKDFFGLFWMCLNPPHLKIKEHVEYL